MIKRLKMFLLLMFLPGLALAGNVVIWSGSAPGGITQIYAVGLKNLIETKTDHTAEIRFSPGAGGLIAIRKFLDSDDQDMHVMVNNDKPAIQTYLTKEIESRDFDRFMPVSFVSEAPYIIHVPATASISSVKELDTLGKSALNFGSVGKGSFGHLVQLSLQQHIKTPLVSVYYKGTSKGIADLIGGHIDIMSGFASDTAEIAASGRTKAIAVSDLIPNVNLNAQTLEQQNLSAMPGNSFWAVYAKKDAKNLSDIQSIMQTIFADVETAREWQKTVKSTSLPYSDSARLAAWWNSTTNFYSNLQSNPVFKDLVKKP